MRGRGEWGVFLAPHFAFIFHLDPAYILMLTYLAQMRLGVHVSIAGKLSDAVDRAEALGCQTMQIFSRNPRGWKLKKVSAKEIEAFKRRREEADIRPLVVHIPYLVNLASPDRALYKRSIEYYIEDIKYADAIGADYFVTHMGSHKGSGERFGLKKLGEALKAVIKKTKPQLQILLEITAGSGNWLGYKFEHLRDVIKRVKGLKLGVCFDTAHAFEAGYDIRTKKALGSTLKAFDVIVGLDRLKVIHINDSKSSLGSRKDRHENIGQGNIGLSGFRGVVNHPALKGLPFILETPKMEFGDDKNNMDIVRGLTHGQELSFRQD